MKKNNEIIINKREHPVNLTYVCNDCVLIFTIHNEQIEYVYCPCCGDNVSVQPFVKVDKNKKEWKAWTPEEFLLVERIVKGELKKYQVAAVTGRSYGAVQRKVEKYMKGVKGNG